MADTWFWTDDGVRNGLSQALGKALPAPGLGTLRLFKNNPVPPPSKTSVIGSFVESTFPGYAGKILNGSNWPEATVTGNVAKSTYPAQTYTRNASGTPEQVYGAYLTDNAGGVLYGCCLFSSGPYTVTNNGDFVTVAPTLTLESKF